MTKPKIGMRNVKTAISVFICLLFFESVNRENPIFACVAAIICMQPTIDNSWDKGLSRIIGTIIGGLLSVFLIVIDAKLTEQFYIFLISLGIIILIEICVFIEKKDSVVIGCVVYLSIMLTQRYEGNYILYTYDRVVDTSFGIIVALLVNRYLIIPKIISDFINKKKENSNYRNDFNDNNSEKVILNELNDNNQGKMNNEENIDIRIEK